MYILVHLCIMNISRFFSVILLAKCQLFMSFVICNVNPSPFKQKKPHGIFRSMPAKPYRARERLLESGFLLL